MNYERFLTYIRGGKVQGSNKIESGCTNKQLPLKKELFTLKRDIRFLNHSTRWDGSVLFLGEPGKHTNYAVRYLIEDDQFIDILKQENNKQLDSNINISSKELQSNISTQVFPNSFYSTLLYLGEYDGYKAYTFTCTQTMFSEIPQQTVTRYLKVILNGINQYNRVRKNILVETFLKVPGIHGYYNFDDLFNLID
jgi:hypothetical protein